MATIIAVHGTFAHMGGEPSEVAAPGVDPQWWQRGSPTEADLEKLVQSTDGPVRFVPFIWDGDNSVLARREAGSELLKHMQALDKDGENYCVVSHSHGGSVVSAALMEASSRGKKLSGLQRWITVGTPFVKLRKETTLFLRLTLFQKAMFVASLMLLLMLGFYAVGEVVTATDKLSRPNWLYRLGISFGMMSLPFVLFWAVFKYLDIRKLYFYRPRNITRAANSFAPRWLGLWHEDDEAVSGLSSVGSIRVNIFHSNFAVPLFSLLSVFLLPVLYFLLLTSPTLMNGIADYLRNDFYQLSQYEQYGGKVTSSRSEVRKLRRSLQRATERLDNIGDDLAERLDAEKEVRDLRSQVKTAREKLHVENPNLVPVERAMRFKRRFLEQDGKPCAGGGLCGGGKDIAINSKLLFHIVTDEASSLFLDNELWRGRLGILTRLILPVVMVPLVFGLIAVLLVFLVQAVAGVLSRFLSRSLDELTWLEIKRSALGNDTETEVAVTAQPRPFWIEESFPVLPSTLGNHITDYSNEIATQSLGKFRNAIGELAFSDGMENKQQNVLSYLTWRELIHSSYFEIPQFRWVIAEAVASTEGFKRSAEFEGSEQSRAAADWLTQIEAKRAKAASTPATN
jgi:hypothetical protein